MYFKLPHYFKQFGVPYEIELFKSILKSGPLSVLKARLGVLLLVGPKDSIILLQDEVDLLLFFRRCYLMEFDVL